MASRRYSELEEDLQEDRGFEASYSCPWMVIYPRGNRDSLDIAQVRDYEKGDWDLASRETFVFEYDARDYMNQLARENGLRGSGPAYLD
jgi:hypothetical protein